ncbi:MAG: tetratricopeptide repeat protein [Acidobacteriota bacterium]|nr:tetratricopeptide repeat protein [Acidobacteriota bacterium]
MKGYSARDVAKLLDMPMDQIRSFAREGFLEPDRGPRGEYRFTFQDLVLLRTAKGLIASRIPPRKVRSALRSLRDRLPSGRPLTAVQIAAQGDHIVVRDGRTLWNPDSGQVEFDFEVSELAEKVAPLARRAAEEAREAEEEVDADDWFDLGCDLEAGAPDQARDSYRRCLELDPDHIEAHLNLGRLLHEAGQLAAALAHYRQALGRRPDYATAAFNLGVVLEDLGRREEATAAYATAIKADPKLADAYYNIARLLEYAGRKAEALEHLKTYRQLIGQD